MPEIRKRMNVREAWHIYDTICVDSTLLGNEEKIGFFPSFATFGAQGQHVFFRSRTEGSAGLAYCNQTARSRSDFVFHCFAIGIHFSGPPTYLESNVAGPELGLVQDYMPIFWMQDLCRNCSVSFQIEQGEKVLAAGVQLSPGYGGMVNGAACGAIDIHVGEDVAIPEFVFLSTNGPPAPASRFWVAVDKKTKKPLPVQIPRNSSISMVLELSEIAKTVLQNAGGPGYIVHSNERDAFPARYEIQASIHGFREVQQRGELATF